MDDDKKLWQSKTFWVAVLTVSVGVLQTTQGELAQGTLFTLAGFVNIILRLVTESKVVLK